MRIIGKRTLLPLTVLAAMLVLAGCPTAKIADIERDPSKYSNRDITIAGKTTSSYGALGSGMYEVDDGSGTMWVYSSNYGVPGNGTKVSVTGRISQGFSFGGRSFAIILKQSQPRH